MTQINTGVFLNIPLNRATWATLNVFMMERRSGKYPFRCLQWALKWYTGAKFGLLGGKRYGSH